jgi:pentatricopeptide repeat protein
LSTIMDCWASVKNTASIVRVFNMMQR